MKDNEIRDLIEHGETDELSGFQAKSGKKFSAKIVLKEKKTEFVFAERKSYGKKSYKKKNGA